MSDLRRPLRSIPNNNNRIVIHTGYRIILRPPLPLLFLTMVDQILALSHHHIRMVGATHYLAAMMETRTMPTNIQLTAPRKTFAHVEQVLGRVLLICL